MPSDHVVASGGFVIRQVKDQWGNPHEPKFVTIRMEKQFMGFETPYFYDGIAFYDAPVAHFLIGQAIQRYPRLGLEMVPAQKIIRIEEADA